jgi:2-octaprenyl-6-methoxyphenol hydroxylase
MPQPLTALVHGAGPTGALAALALADAGWQVWLGDPQPAAVLQRRSRAYALSHSSQRLLDRLGLWAPLQLELVPFRQLQLQDQAAGRAVLFQPADLGRRRGQLPWAALGWIIQHSSLMAVLLHALERHPAIALALGAGPVAAAAPAAADLEVAADGSASPRRAAAGIGVWHWPYRQSCLTVQVGLRGAPDGQAWELFRPEGPFAVLPLAGHRFQLVWSAPTRHCQRLEQLGDAAFLDALAGVLPEPMEVQQLLDQPRSFPVGWLLARRLQRGRLVLVGESAHRCHPVGGQGLNLCWRDVAELHRQAGRVAAGRLAGRHLAAAYGRRRWADLLLTLAATDLLVRLFSNRNPLLLPLRSLGLLLLARLAPLRRFSLGLMTDGPGLSW